MAFAEVEKFIDTPVKRYSSGMYVRLAFAVAAHLEPEILIMDEVLAVGDAAFQKKCLGKMGDVAKEGRTVLFVSHNMGAISQLCPKTIVISQGIVNFLGLSNSAIKHYLSDKASYGTDRLSDLFSGPLSSNIKINLLEVNNEQIDSHIIISPASPVTIRVTGLAKKEIKQCSCVYIIKKDGMQIATLHDTIAPALLSEGKFESEVSIPPYLLRPGEYFITYGCYSDNLREWTSSENVGIFTILEEWDRNYQEKNHGIINLPFSGKRIQ